MKKENSSIYPFGILRWLWRFRDNSLHRTQWNSGLVCLPFRWSKVYAPSHCAIHRVHPLHIWKVAELRAFRTCQIPSPNRGAYQNALPPDKSTACKASTSSSDLVNLNLLLKSFLNLRRVCVVINFTSPGLWQQFLGQNSFKFAENLFLWTCQST